MCLMAGCRPAGVEAASPSPARAESVADELVDESGGPGLECGRAIAGTEGLFEPGSLTLVGEIHGTVQVPEAVGRLACHCAQRGDAGTTVALEVPVENQPSVDAYLESDGAEQARAALLAAPHFARARKDGRNSLAMLELLDAVRVWRSQGAAIDVLCFDVDPGSYATSTERDARMAKTIVTYRRAHPRATLIALSGNLHSQTRPGVPWNADFTPMGAWVRKEFPDLVALDFRSASGTTWACMGDAECGEVPIGTKDRGPEPFVTLFDTADERGFDGVLYVGATTASAPAVSPG